MLVPSMMAQVTFLSASSTKVLEFWTIVLRTDSECAVSALSTAVCQGRTEETIFENSTKYLSAGMGASEGTNRMEDGRLAVERSILGGVWCLKYI